ncbi:CopD family protein [Thermosporothrix hazakensis]|nr:CopD family protein [Thermosporothrix hazakensis]
MRVAHVLSAALWVGGCVMYQFVIMPALRNGGPAPGVAAQIASLFHKMTQICAGVLLLSGAYLIFDRLTMTALGWPYFLVLGLKLVLVAAMLLLVIYLGQSQVRRLAKQTSRLSKRAPQLMLALGIGVFILGALLNILYIATIAPR